MKTQNYYKYKIIGLKIGYYRRKKGITQAELAEQIGKHPSFISALESPNIDKALSLDTLFDISKALDTAPYKFLKDDW